MKDIYKNINFNRFNYLIFFYLLSLYGCISSTSNIKSEANDAGFESQYIQTISFELYSYIKSSSKSDSLVVYIEGDGHAWKRRNVLSSDPTPETPISLKLAVKDHSDSVAYLARPCQYLNKAKLKNCHPRYWSSHRYSKKVVTSISDAISKIKTQASSKTIQLVGYSGGGVVAMLVAAHRDDVSGIITVASNIDHKSWSDWHGVTQLGGSLSPMNYLEKLEHITQQHYWGEEDRIVPFSTQESFVEKLKNIKESSYQVIPGYNHTCCWHQDWQKLRTLL